MTTPRPPPSFSSWQVLPTQLVPDETEGKILRVRLIMKDGKKLFDPVYLFDQGSTVSWIPCGRKLTCSFPGERTWHGHPSAGLRLDCCKLPKVVEHGSLQAQDLFAT